VGVDGVGSGVGVAVRDTDGFGAACTMVFPAFHTNFLPFFTQVYCFPPAIDTWPNFLQLPPALTAELVGEIGMSRRDKSAATTILTLAMS